jgi:hypothetical protein
LPLKIHYFETLMYFLLYLHFVLINCFFVFFLVHFSSALDKESNYMSIEIIIYFNIYFYQNQTTLKCIKLYICCKNHCLKSEKEYFQSACMNYIWYLIALKTNSQCTNHWLNGWNPTKSSIIVFCSGTFYYVYVHYLCDCMNNRDINIWYNFFE